jgi:hypothetical protein
MNLNAVKVKFDNSSYNYITSVSAQFTERDCNDYFVGIWINMGQYPVDDFQRCTSIEFIAKGE